MARFGIYKNISKCFSTLGQGLRLDIQNIEGEKKIEQDTKNVTLRGIKMKGMNEDMPALIFFPDIFDSAENWMSFFINSRNPILNMRDVYIIYPRNQGTSDWCNTISSEPAEDIVSDIERFMYVNKISTATLGGHGFGAKNALLMGCYKPHLMTGLLALNWAPQDYTYFRSGHNLKDYLDQICSIENLENMSFKDFRSTLEEKIQNLKIRTLLEQQFKLNDKGKRQMMFNKELLNERIDDLVSWKSSYGVYGGRSRFIFPDSSEMVHLGTNTLSMMKVCTQNRGYLEDIKTIDVGNNDNPEYNHWIYEDNHLADQAAFHSCEFIHKFDGVNVLLKNRAEMREGFKIPVLKSESKDGTGASVAPEHYHHNWRFNSK